MTKRLEYVSPEYQDQLEELAERLVTPERFGEVVLARVIELPVRETPEDLEA